MFSNWDGFQAARTHRDLLLAGAALLGFAAAFFLPAVIKGAFFGPYGLGAAASSLMSGAAVPPNNGINGDIIQELIPWNLFDWRSFHELTFPLWNPYTLLGTPQFANFVSSALSLPDIISYLAPAWLAFDVTVFCKLIIAGLGTYYFVRKLGVSFWPAVFSGMTFMLSGPFANEIGWPLADVFAWMGWIFGATYALYLDSSATWPRWILMLAVAFAIYGGFPEADVLMGILWVVYFGGLLVGEKRESALAFMRSAVWCIVLGTALAAPLWIPGAVLAIQSVRVGTTNIGLPLPSIVLAVFQGYYGYPLSASQWFGPSNYYETVA